jgi:hypothetical protein
MELDQISTQFEAQWRTGPRPRVADFLSTASVPMRHDVLLKLVGIDVDYRLRVGETLLNPEPFNNSHSEVF